MTTRRQWLSCCIIPLSGVRTFSVRPILSVIRTSVARTELYQQERPSEENGDDDVSAGFFESVETWMKGNIVTNKDPLKGYTLEDLEEYAKDSKNRTSPKLVFDEPEDDEAPWIEAEAYTQLDEEDDDGGSGSFTMDPEYQQAFQSFIQQQSPLDSSDTVAPSDDSPDELWNMVRNKGLNISNFYDPVVAEDLHRQVFALEEGYLDNSDIFRDALIDPSQAKAASYQRRGESFRDRQRELLSQLNEKIVEFDQLRETAPKCSECWCMLVLEERRSPDPKLCIQCYEAAKSEEQQLKKKEEPEEKKSKSPWKRVVDPETKEPFYWNDETQDMRYDRPDDED